MTGVQTCALPISEDRAIRDLLYRKLENAAVTKILIERAAQRVRIKILTARPGVVIGRRGAEIDIIKEELARMTNKEVYVDIQEIRQPETDAQLVAENVKMQLERRIAYRRAMKDRKSTRLNSSHALISYAVFCLKKKKKKHSAELM